MARPTLPSHLRRVDLDITVSPEIRDAIEVLSEQLKLNRSRVAESLIERGLRSLRSTRPVKPSTPTARR